DDEHHHARDRVPAYLHHGPAPSAPPPVRTSATARTAASRRPSCPPPGKDPGRCRMIRRPSIVHDRAQPVQPSTAPNRAEVFSVRPPVPPQTQLSPGATLRALRARRTVRAAPVASAAGTARNMRRFRGQGRFDAFRRGRDQRRLTQRWPDVWHLLEQREVRRLARRRAAAPRRPLPRPDRPAGTDLLPQISHIVVLMMENHSYDNYLGMLRGSGEGFPRGWGGRPKVSNRGADGKAVRAFHLSST